MSFDPAILGLPVELSQIQAQLKALWDGGTRTRASLLNFVVYCRDTEGFEANTALISRFVRNHACRAILVGEHTRPQTADVAATPKLSAWVQAHCHITKAGAQEVCSEQITLLAEGVSEKGIANALLANLDYDLPLNLWWQGSFPEAPSSPIWARVDRLLFDSLHWSNPAQELQHLANIRAKANTCMTIADLNWTRTLMFRQALAECFDSPSLISELAHITSLEIQHAPDARMTALLLASWFCAQLGWTFKARSADGIAFVSPAGHTITCHFTVGAGDAISRVRVHSEHLALDLEREVETPLLCARLKASGTETSAHYPAGSNALENLLTEELTHGPKHRVYLKALDALQLLAG